MSKTYIHQTEEFGRGVYANQAIMKGTTIMVCELLVLNENDTLQVNQTDLQYYTFKYTDTQDCLVMGDGEMYNHSDYPNTSYTIQKYQGRDHMVFKALTNIAKSEQLFIDYAADTNVDPKQYTVNLLSKTGE